MKYIVKTDVGVVRTENQDRANVFINDKYTLAILCDGMGGHSGGSMASIITIDTFQKTFLKHLPKSEDEFQKWFVETLKKSKKNMVKVAKKDKKLLDMGTTITAAIIGPNNIMIFNVGDSRTYIYNGLLIQKTVDHNVRNHYINELGYSQEKAATVTFAAALTSALGPTKRTNLEMFTVEKKGIEYIILTSDGIHDYIAKPVFESIISSDLSLEEKATNMISRAIKGKSSDNLTIVIVEVK